MKKLVALILVLVSVNSFAGVRFHNLETNEITNSKFKALAAQWEREFDIDDAGVYGFEVSEMNASNKWEMTVRNIFYIKDYCHDEKEADEIQELEDIFPATKRLINDMAYLELPESDRALDRLANKYSEMIQEFYQNPDFMVLDGYSNCDSMYSGHSEITIIDKVNNQYIVLYGGYSE
jgi:hypothetical protein